MEIKIKKITVQAIEEMYSGMTEPGEVKNCVVNYNRSKPFECLILNLSIQTKKSSQIDQIGKKKLIFH